MGGRPAAPQNRRARPTLTVAPESELGQPFPPLQECEGARDERHHRADPGRIDFRDGGDRHVSEVDIVVTRSIPVGAVKANHADT